MDTPFLLVQFLCHKTQSFTQPVKDLDTDVKVRPGISTCVMEPRDANPMYFSNHGV